MITLGDVLRQSLAAVADGFAAAAVPGGSPPGPAEQWYNRLRHHVAEPATGLRLAQAAFFLAFAILLHRKKGVVRPEEILATPEMVALIEVVAEIFTRDDPDYRRFSKVAAPSVAHGATPPAASVVDKAHAAPAPPPASSRARAFLGAWIDGQTFFSAAEAADNFFLDLLIDHDRRNHSTLAGRVMDDSRYLVHALAMADHHLCRAEREVLAFLDREAAKVKAAIGDQSVFSVDDHAASLAADNNAELLVEAKAQLDQLIGLAEIKSEIERLTAFLTICRLRREHGLAVADLTLHFVFKGNPGTGKTTVARILGKLFKGLGYLKKGHLIETDRSGMVAEYLGQTAVKTRNLAASAQNGILFIDEAYSLSRSGGGGADQYGLEAIETLLKFMEDNRASLVVIVAGYPALMDAFIAANPGLHSRFTRYLDFVDYTPVELCRIAHLLAKKADYRFTLAAKAVLRERITQAHKERGEGFGNARFVRNLFEAALQSQAMRLTGLDRPPERDELRDLHPGDLAEAGKDLVGLPTLCRLPCPELATCQLAHHPAELSPEEWREQCPVLVDLSAYRPALWVNPAKSENLRDPGQEGLDATSIAEAAARLKRFRPCIARAFPETEAAAGVIESPLIPIDRMRTALGVHYGVDIAGPLLLKCDHLLPIAGSVKARGGIYQVLCHVQAVAEAEGLLAHGEDPTVLLGEEARTVFAERRIAVGSTGNLGLAVGIVGARFGFAVTVHMSVEAKTWKKELLRRHGVTVVEHRADYGQAVAEGRKLAANDGLCHFVDDENSLDLFLGYATAAERLAQQLTDSGIKVDAEHPLVVYLPCGVGGAPGGITFGLKNLFGDHVHCFFAEPTHAPCMLLGLATGLHDRVSIHDFSLDGKTEADGLAVSRPSGFVGRRMAASIAGVFTVDDQELYRLLALLADSEGQFMEPSALAGMFGPIHLQRAVAAALPLPFDPSRATHVVWGTGGRLVPETEMAAWYKRGQDGG
jgi:D-serine dehydratase